MIQAEGDIADLVNGEFSIVDFYSDGCVPCRMLEGILARLESEMPFIRIIRANISQSPEYAEEFGISATPTLVYFKDGEVCGRTVGFKTLDALRETVGAYLYD